MTNVPNNTPRPKAAGHPATLASLNEKILACRLCPRLIRHCTKVAREKRASYRDDTYHGKPVPNFLAAGRARLLIVGLAPGAHGANRTGRMFTGDRSGDFLYRAMHDTGFASQAEAVSCGDGLKLKDTVITAAAHCAPPGNKPTPRELANCAPFLEQTFDLLPKLRVVLCLGRLALDAVLKLYKARGWVRRLADHPFAHGACFTAFEGTPKPPAVLCSFHPSQQNTFTGRLTPTMLRQVFEQARKRIGKK